MSDDSRSTVRLSFVAIDNTLLGLSTELEGFEEYASGDGAIVYEVPQSPVSDMLLELKITSLEDTPLGRRLVEFRRYKKPPPRTVARGFGRYGGDDGWGGDGWGGGGDQYDDDESDE